ncbi:MAG: hypothetical protein Q7S89_01835 [bacterium]|nr:hypothetical protein [bacterium]
MKNTKRALLWITEILKSRNVPFVISGGFAARMYGSNRPLADIDIDIPESGFKDIFDDVKKYVYWGPKRLKDRYWDLPLYMAIKYSGQVIDISGAYKGKIFDKKTRRWTPLKRNLNKGELHKIYNTTVPLIPLKDLIKYKKMLGRKVDVFDVQQLTEKSTP